MFHEATQPQKLKEKLQSWAKKGELVDPAAVVLSWDGLRQLSNAVSKRSFKVLGRLPPTLGE